MDKDPARDLDRSAKVHPQHIEFAVAGTCDHVDPTVDERLPKLADRHDLDVDRLPHFRGGSPKEVGEVSTGLRPLGPTDDREASLNADSYPFGLPSISQALELSHLFRRRPKRGVRFEPAAVDPLILTGETYVEQTAVDARDPSARITLKGGDGIVNLGEAQTVPRLYPVSPDFTSHTLLAAIANVGNAIAAIKIPLMGKQRK